MTELLNLEKKRPRDTSEDVITLSTNEKQKKLNKDVTETLSMIRQWQEQGEESALFTESYSLAVNNFFDDLFSIEFKKVNLLHISE